MRQFVAYLRKTLHLGALAKATLRDSRRRPQIGGDLCFLLTVLMLVQRYPSFHSFEDLLDEKPLRRLFGKRRFPQCTQTIKDALKKMDIDSVRRLHERILKIAAGNKAFDLLLFHQIRALAFDGVEPFSSWKRSCNGCQTRVHHTDDGEETEFFHRFVFLQSIGPEMKLLLGFQHQDNLAQRKAKSADAVKAEGELTAVKPLVDRLRKLFPKMFTIAVGDALYANGPMFDFIRQGDGPMDMIAVLKKETDEPMADALRVFADAKPMEYYDEKRQEHVRLWDEEGFEGLDTCPYPLRVAKALVIKGPANIKLKPKDWQSRKVHTWWSATGTPKSRLAGPQAFDILRHRWNIENNAFNDLTQNWNFKHAYLHHENGLQIMMYAFMIAFNLFQLFLYRCLRDFRKSSVTAVSIAGQMKTDLPTITDAEDGFYPIDSS
jgi:hypothetical protein